MVNIDTETLRRIDSLAALSRESRSAVVAEVLQLFAPMFEPVAVALDKVRSQPAEAVRMLKDQADTLQTMTAELVERAKHLDSPASGPGAEGAARTPATGSARAKRGPRPPAQ